MKTVLVVAGNFKEFRNRIGEMTEKARDWQIDLANGRAVINGTIYHYISDPIHMKGYRGVEVETWGTWLERDDAKQFEQEIMALRLKETAITAPASLAATTEEKK